MARFVATTGWDAVDESRTTTIQEQLLLLTCASVGFASMRWAEEYANDFFGFAGYGMLVAVCGISLARLLHTRILTMLLVVFLATFIPMLAGAIIIALEARS